MTAAMYTGAPMPMRYLCVPMRRYLIILPTGKMTPALAERDILVAFFFPPLADILICTAGGRRNTSHCDTYSSF